MISMPQMIERAARLNPQGLATRCNGRQRNWQETGNRISRLGSALNHLEFEEGDRVGILSLNSDRYYEALFAIVWAGYCVVPLNTRWAVPENDYALTDSGTRALFFDDSFEAQAHELLDSVASLTVAIYMGEGDCPPWAQSLESMIDRAEPCVASPRSGEDMAGIFYTGGTTGFPKGVMQSHRAIWASAMGSVPYFKMGRDSIYLHAAPMFHMADLAGSMGATLNCAGNFMLTSFEPGQALQTIANEGITHTLWVPAMIKMALNHPEAGIVDGSVLECILYGASPMPAATLEQCMSIWPDVGLVQAYGQTELAPVVTMLSAEDHRIGGERLKSAGRPTPVNDVRIVGDDGEDCATGVSGEVVVRGPHTMLGYWNKPDETTKALQNGWVFTGDAGLFDDDGFLYIVDRVKDMVVTGGENVFTTEVENAVISHPAVQDVAVIGIPHDDWGEAVHAIVILHEDQSVSEDELVEHCRAQIAGYKLPKGVTYRKEPLPLSGAGKVLKTELRKPWWEGRDRQVG
ncbi:MAG: AMP-binding protein [Halioglobus sp.]